jgi:hypothetical protein
MTFIASVIAKDGVAIVADSFVTTLDWSIEWDDFKDYVNKKPENSIDIDEIKALFKQKASHTRNYTEKLFQFCTHSAISTAGMAFLNDKPIKQIVSEFEGMHKALPNYEQVPIEDILNSFVSTLRVEIESHIEKYGYIDQTDFIFSHFNLSLGQPQIFKIEIPKTKKDEIKAGGENFVKFTDQTNIKIVTDGQDTMIDRLLFGSLYKNGWLQYYLADKICTHLNVKKKTKDKVHEYLDNENLLEPLIRDEIDYVKRRPLSLQEAVDFAALLVRIVINIQAYTEKIPTVGGVIKLAVIDKNGYENINGHEIIKPNLLY